MYLVYHSMMGRIDEWLDGQFGPVRTRINVSHLPDTTALRVFLIIGI
jgi:hypothetical protein